MQVKLSTVKFVTNIVTGAGVSKVVNDVIRNNTTVETTTDAVKVGIGSVVLGSMIADKATEHVFAKIDAADRWITEFKQRKQDTEPADQ